MRDVIILDYLKEPTEDRFKNFIIGECRRMDRLDVYEWVASDELRIKQLQQDKQQLKEENERLQEQKDFWRKEFVDKKEQKDFWRKEFVDKKEQLDLYKSVIDEVREEIKDLLGHWKGNDLVERDLNELLEILDKVKEMSNE